jgi:phosphoribosylformylglycinamidine synthase subunit PurQ / glutaminase
MKKVGVLRFLGTNCDQDVLNAVRNLGMQGEFVWYQDHFNWQTYSALLLPGGFSHGDYLRSGALAARAPVIESVRDAAKKGVPILGICNGFQILCETGLLPGALLRNTSLRFVDKWVRLKKVSSAPKFATGLTTARLPVAHGDGRYFIANDQLQELHENDQVWWTYEENPNGSIESIAGVMNREKNVAGLMPHPERAVADWMGSEDGVAFFKELLQ